MNTSFPTDLGSTLYQLRITIGMKQAEVARQLKVDASRVSRIETGDFSPTIDEVASYLAAIGSEDALAYLAFLRQDWQQLLRPAFTHPDRDTLWQADQALQRMHAFINRSDAPRTLRGQAELYQRTLQQAAAYLADRMHRVAYIGDIGVGKTSFLCSQLDLVLPETDKGGLQSRMVLEAGGGGTTVCEVRVVQGAVYGMKIEPMDDTEVYRLASEFCAGIWAKGPGSPSQTTKAAGDDDPEQVFGVSREVERALRNMAGLNRTREKGPDGKMHQVDPALVLAARFDAPETFRAEVAQRLTLWNRMRREIWCVADAAPDALAELKATFTKINNGRHPDFSLPERMYVLVKQPLLAAATYDLEVIDTKGVDKVAVRPDLQRFVDDPRTITVLCSKFNSAPDVSLQGFVKHLQDMGLEQALKERTALLILPRSDEAVAMKDDAGLQVETADEGYELKAEQVALRLASIGADHMPVYFSDISADDPTSISTALLARLACLRAAQAQRITATAAAFDDLVANEAREHTQAALREVARKVAVFGRTYQQVPARSMPVHHVLLAAVEAANARAVWASTRRNGQWGNLNVYYHLGVGATTDARRRTDGVLGELTGILQNMRDDTELAPAHPFLDTLQVNIRTWRTTFLEVARQAGEFSFRPALEDDASFWQTCEDMYGKGLPYRRRVSQEFAAWFAQPDHARFYTAFEERIQHAWFEQIIGPLQRLAQLENDGEDEVAIQI